jgi:hypothetical protein
MYRTVCKNGKLQKKKKKNELSPLLTHHSRTINRNNNNSPPAIATPMIQGSTLLGTGTNLSALTYVATYKKHGHKYID